jgi:hypothetical protein
MTDGFSRLNIRSPRSVQRRERNHFSPYSTVSLRRQSGHGPASQRPTASHFKTAPQRFLSKQSQDTTQKAWGILISKTAGFVDIKLEKRITSIGKMVDFVDVETGERARQYRNFRVRVTDSSDCALIKFPNGDVTARAITPILIDGTCIKDGAKVVLQNGQTISLCDNEMTVMSEYRYERYD